MIEAERDKQLERCPHFRGCYVQASMDIGHDDVSLLERCSNFRGTGFNGVTCI